MRDRGVTFPDERTAMKPSSRRPFRRGLDVSGRELAHSERELELTAALYASRPGVMDHLRATGSLPAEIQMPGAEVGLRHLIAERGTDITLTADERLVFEAILREGRLPGGHVVLVEGKGS